MWLFFASRIFTFYQLIFTMCPCPIHIDYYTSLGNDMNGAYLSVLPTLDLSEQHSL